MNLEDLIRAWKADEEALEPSPVGREITEEELLAIAGGCCGTFESSRTPICGPDQLCTINVTAPAR